MSKYNKNEINRWIKEYEKCHSFSKVARKFGVPRSTLALILKNNGVKSTKDLIKEGKKKCTGPKGCGKVKTLDNFRFRKSDSIYDNLCKRCLAKDKKEYAIKNKKKIKIKQKIYYENNKEILNEKKKVYRKNNKEKIKKAHTIWRQNNPDKIRLLSSKWATNNRDKINSALKCKRDNNINFRLEHNLRSRLKVALKNNQKSGSAIEDLGCSIWEFKKHLEAQFYLHPNTKEKMNWDNYGLCGWHIDHIKPIMIFDLTDRVQFLKACHYTNLQPLWAEDHKRKTKRDLDENKANK